MSEPESPASGLAPGVTPQFKLALIGSHGVGKTTLCFGVAARLKTLDFPVEVVHEVARRCPLPINRETSLDSQAWILHTQISEEIVAQHRYPIVVCDRSVLDNYVYLLLAAHRIPALEILVDSWLPTYQLLAHVPILERPRADGIRSSDPAFQMAVEDRLLKELARRQLPVIHLDPTERQTWVESVVTEVRRRLHPAQLELLWSSGDDSRVD